MMKKLNVIASKADVAGQLIMIYLMTKKTIISPLVIT